jgi:L-ascorbate metabolism protein UlaG (beta-lactamase superfamily)
MPVSNREALLSVTYIGGPTLLLEIGGLRLLTDPTFDRAGSQYDRLQKLTKPAIRADRIGRIDAVLLSHDQHPDNLDNTGRALLGGAGQVVTTPQAAARLRGKALGLEPWEATDIERPDGERLRVTATPARHGPPGCESYMGAVTGFVVSWSGEPRSAIYISGDTVFFEEISEVSERFSIGIAVLHLGDAHVAARGPHRLTMNAEEGVHAAQVIRPHTVLPVHYDGWAHFQESKEQAQKVFTASTLRCRILWLEPGIPTVFRP